jgi:hypothetical protein
MSADVDVLNEQTLATSLAAVLSCTDLLADGMPRLTRTVALDMIRAETQRAIAALRTSHALKHGVSQERRLAEPRALVDAVREFVTPEARLRGSRLTTTIDVPDSARLRVDTESIVDALSSVVLLLSAGLHDVQGARLEIKATASGADRVTFVIAQESVIVPDAYLKIVTAGAEAAMPVTAPLVALRRVADAHGGTANATRLAHGTQVSLELPLAAGS